MTSEEIIMNDHHKNIAQKSLDGAYDATMSFPEIVKTLSENGFESYHIDYLRGTATHYLADGGHFELAMPLCPVPIAKEFAVTTVQAAIKEAQQQVDGYTYKGFCEKVKAAGCAGYIVSFAGRRAVYLGRTGEMHTEHFPQ